MNCNDVNSRLPEYLGEELPARERLELEAHLAECVTCRAEVEADRRTLATLSQLHAAPADVARRQTDRLIVTLRPHPFVRAAWAAMRTAGVLALGAVLGRTMLSPKPAAPIEVARHQPTMLAAATPIHPRWIDLAKRCERGGGSSFACQLAVLAETAKQ
jgi:anti-sigma factor RsiW